MSRAVRASSVASDPPEPPCTEAVRFPEKVFHKMYMRISADHSLLRRLALAVVASLAVVALSGCGIFSPDESNDGGGGTTTGNFLPPYVSSGEAGRNQAISNLEQAYELMNYEEYEKLIHTDYIFRVDPNDVNIVGQDELSAADDLASTYSMFNSETGEEPVLDAQGNPTGDVEIVPPVQQIRLTLTPASGSAWTLMQDGEFAGTWRRIYEVDMTVNYSGDGRRDSIQGKQVFYLIAGTIVQDGNVLNVWQLRAWEDQGINS